MKPTAKLVLALMLVAVAVLLGGRYYLTQRPQASLLEIRALATWGLGRYLATNYPGSKALVLANPFSQQEDIDKRIRLQEEGGILGLKKAFQPDIELAEVVYPKLYPEAYNSPGSLVTDPSVVTPLSFMMDPEAVARLPEEYPGCELWVSLIGLPLNVTLMEIWKTPEPRFALLLPDLRVIGGEAQVREAMRSGKLTAFVITIPGAIFDATSLSDDWQREFDERYLVVTADNLDSILQKYPTLIDTN